MANRIGITDPPIATLGQPGTKQSLPLIEEGEGPKIEAKRTTIADMTTFFEGEIPVENQQIQRFITDDTTNIPLDLTAATPSGLGTDFYEIYLTETNKIVFVGDQDFYSANGNAIFASETGVYRTRWNIVGNYTIIGDQGGWRWNTIIVPRGAGRRQGQGGKYIRPGRDVENVTLGIANGEITFRLEAGNAITYSVRFRNIGSLPSGDRTQESIQIMAELAPQKSYITIERLA